MWIYDCRKVVTLIKSGSMSSVVYKNKITKHLSGMDATTLKKAWLILKEISTEKTPPVITDKQTLEHQLSRGIRQLDNGEGTEFSSFIKELKKRHGRD